MRLIGIDAAQQLGLFAASAVFGLILGAVFLLFEAVGAAIPAKGRGRRAVRGVFDALYVIAASAGAFLFFESFASGEVRAYTVAGAALGFAAAVGPAKKFYKRIKNSKKPLFKSRGK